MSVYDPGEGPPDAAAGLRGWIWTQLNRIAAALREPEPRAIRLVQLNAVPAKLYSGLTVFADGVNWNPGGGQGVYTYYAGAWNKLG